MKTKHIVIWILIFTFLAPYLPHVAATEANANDEVVIVDEERYREIDRLFALRMSLEHDYEGNRNAINEIDQQLIQLGVEMLSTEESISLFSSDGVMPLGEPESTSTVQWTSRRLITTYRGYHFEVQILEGIPTSGSSPLRKNYSKVSYKAQGITAGVTKAIAVTTVSAFAEFLPGTINAGVTLLDMLSGSAEIIQENLSTSTIIDQVEGTALLSFIGHMKYVRVKPYQTLDATHQGLYYIGNSVSCIITTASAVDVVVNGQLVTYHEVETSVEDTIQSQYYNDYSQAVKNYWDYNYNYNDYFQQDYTVYIMGLNILGSIDTYMLPRAIHPNMVEE